MPLRPLGLWEIYDGAFRAVRSNPTVMFGVSAVIVALAVVVQTVAQALTLDPLLVGLENPDLSGADVDVTTAVSTVLAYLGTLVASSLAITVLSGLLVLSVSRSVIGRRLSIGEFWALAGGRVWRLLALTLLLLLVSTLVLGAWAGALAWTVMAQAWAALLAVVFLGGLAVLVFTLWFTTRTLLATPALVLEDLSILGGLKRGWGLSRGGFWRLLGIWLLTQVVVGIVTQIVTLPFALLAGVLAGLGTGTSSSATLLLTAVAVLIAQCLTVPFVAGVTGLLYIDTRIRREGLDVELARAAEAVAAEDR